MYVRCFRCFRCCTILMVVAKGMDESSSLLSKSKRALFGVEPMMGENARRGGSQDPHFQEYIHSMVFDLIRMGFDRSKWVSRLFYTEEAGNPKLPHVWCVVSGKPGEATHQTGLRPPTAKSKCFASANEGQPDQDQRVDDVVIHKDVVLGRQRCAPHQDDQDCAGDGANAHAGAQ